VQDGGGDDDDPGGVEVGPHHPEDREPPLPHGEHVLAHDGADGREALVEELIQRIVQLLPIVVGLDEHRRDGVGGVPCDEVEPRLCPSLQIRSHFGPGPDTGVMGPARPVTVKVANQKLVIADNLKH